MTKTNNIVLECKLCGLKSVSPEFRESAQGTASFPSKVRQETVQACGQGGRAGWASGREPQLETRGGRQTLLCRIREQSRHFPGSNSGGQTPRKRTGLGQRYGGLEDRAAQCQPAGSPESRSPGPRPPTPSHLFPNHKLHVGMV